MARQYFIVLAASILVLLVSSATATDSPATAYIKKTCNDATYVDLCLNTLLPNADRINGNPKKTARLAISAVLSQVQTTPDYITHLAKQPQLWTREVESLNVCATIISNTFRGLLEAMRTTGHLGGGSKTDKESKRLRMMDGVTSVIRANTVCMNNLEKSRAREDVLNRVTEDTELLVQLATNAVDLIHRMEF